MRREYYVKYAVTLPKSWSHRILDRRSVNEFLKGIRSYIRFFECPIFYLTVVAENNKKKTIFFALKKNRKIAKVTNKKFQFKLYHINSILNRVIIYHSRKVERSSWKEDFHED